MPIEEIDGPDLRPRLAQIGLRFFEMALVGLGLIFIIGNELTQRIWYLAIWDISAAIYIIYGMLSVRRMAMITDVVPIPVQVAPKYQRVRTLFLFDEQTVFSTFASSITGVAAAVSIVFYRGRGNLNHTFEVLAVVAMICAWMMLHTGYARLYQRLYYEEKPEGGLEFPSNEPPNDADFIYFSFTIGTTFAASDVDISSRRIRWYVTVHSILSFFYNTAVLALAVGILTGG